MFNSQFKQFKHFLVEINMCINGLWLKHFLKFFQSKCRHELIQWHENIWLTIALKNENDVTCLNYVFSNVLILIISN